MSGSYRVINIYDKDFPPLELIKSYGDIGLQAPLSLVNVGILTSLLQTLIWLQAGNNTRSAMFYAEDEPV